MDADQLQELKQTVVCVQEAEAFILANEVKKISKKWSTGRPRD